MNGLLLAEEYIGDAFDFSSFVVDDGAEVFIILHEFLEGGSAISEIDAELFSLFGKFLHCLCDFDSVKRSLSELFVVLDEIITFLLQAVILLLHLLEECGLLLDMLSQVEDFTIVHEMLPPMECLRFRTIEFLAW